MDGGEGYISWENTRYSILDKTVLKNESNKGRIRENKTKSKNERNQVADA